jgi:hypothetical protein
MGVREYLPSLGRWLSADTIVPRADDPQSLNRFSYVRNSPLSRIDPTGHADCENRQNGCPGSEPEPEGIVAKAKRTIVDAYKEQWVHYLARRFIEHYAYGEGKALRLSKQEALATNPFIDLGRDKNFIAQVDKLRAAGGGTVKFSGKVFGGSGTSGTLGQFTANVDGSIAVDQDGNWAFVGSVDFYDKYDFDPGNNPDRSELGTLFTLIGTVLPGTGFEITSDSMLMTQTSSQNYAQFEGPTDYVPQVVSPPIYDQAKYWLSVKNVADSAKTIGHIAIP